MDCVSEFVLGVAVDKNDYFIEFRCPNTLFEGDSYTCSGELAGVSLKTLRALDFTKAPFEDIRYCPKCGIFWHIEIKNLTDRPEFTEIKRKPGEKSINFVKVEDLFGFFESSGGKYKERKDQKDGKGPNGQ